MTYLGFYRCIGARVNAPCTTFTVTLTLHQASSGDCAKLEEMNDQEKGWKHLDIWYGNSVTLLSVSK